MPEHGREHSKYFMWEHKGQGVAVLCVGVGHPDGQGLMATARKGLKSQILDQNLNKNSTIYYTAQWDRVGNKNLDVTPGDCSLL